MMLTTLVFFSSGSGTGNGFPFRLASTSFLPLPHNLLYMCKLGCFITLCSNAASGELAKDLFFTLKPAHQASNSVGLSNDRIGPKSRQL
jgi:hypothetical protein